MEYVIMFRYNESDSTYYPVQSGRGVVPNAIYDKVLPVEEHVSYQMHKVIFKDGKLTVLPEWKNDFMSKEQFDDYMAKHQNEKNYGGVGALIREEDIKPKITKVEM